MSTEEIVRLSRENPNEPCPECGAGPFKGTNGLSMHLNRVHGIVRPGGDSKRKAERRAAQKRRNVDLGLTPILGDYFPNGSNHPNSNQSRGLKRIRAEERLVSMVQELYPKGIPTKNSAELIDALSFIDQLRRRLLNGS